MLESGLTKNQIIAELARSSHGNLHKYLDVGMQATESDPEFMGHLIAWNWKKGQIRDSKTALPVITLTLGKDLPEEIRENSLAHMALLDARNLLKAVRFGKELKVSNRSLRYVVRKYLKNLEVRGKDWERVTLQHRNTMKELYALMHVKPSEFAQNVLFKRKFPKGSSFEAVQKLSTMSEKEAASAIVKHSIPFLTAQGALGKRIEEPSLAIAIIDRMSPTELVTNTRLLNSLGVKEVPAVKAAYSEALEKAAKSKKATLKTTRAAEVVEDKELKGKLQDLQEKQLDTVGRVEGNWLVLADRSLSMEEAIEVSNELAAILAVMVKGKVHLVFFNYTPRYLDATGKTVEQLKAETKLIRADGATSIGSGVQYAIENNLDVDGIAIVSDGGENTLPHFANTYQTLCKNLGKDIPAYLYRLRGDYDRLASDCANKGVLLEEFDFIGKDIDYYSLLNAVQTMRSNRYSLADEIMKVPLLKLSDVFKPRKEKVHA
jgi:hypothetical protein